MQIRKLARPLLFVIPAVGALLFGLVSIVDAGQPTKYQVTVSDSSSGFVVETIPPLVADDIYKVGFANNSVESHVLVVVGGLQPGITEDEFADILDAVGAGAPPPEGAFEAGAVFAKPGQDHQKLFDVTTTGQYGFFCPIPGPDGTLHYKQGFIGLFTVVEFP